MPWRQGEAAVLFDKVDHTKRIIAHGLANTGFVTQVNVDGERVDIDGTVVGYPGGGGNLPVFQVGKCTQ